MYGIILIIMYYVLCIMYYVLCIMYYVLCIMYYVLCISIIFYIKINNHREYKICRANYYTYIVPIIIPKNLYITF